LAPPPTPGTGSVVSTVWRSPPLSEEELSELPECVLCERLVRRAERGVTQFRSLFLAAGATGNRAKCESSSCSHGIEGMELKELRAKRRDGLSVKARRKQSERLPSDIHADHDEEHSAAEDSVAEVAEGSLDALARHAFNADDAQGDDGDVKAVAPVRITNVAKVLFVLAACIGAFFLGSSALRSIQLHSAEGHTTMLAAASAPAPALVDIRRVRASLSSTLERYAASLCMDDDPPIFAIPRNESLTLGSPLRSLRTPILSLTCGS